MIRIEPSVLSTEESLTVFWDKPAAETQSSAPYEIYADGRKAGETLRTHFLLEGLSPDTEYELQIFSAGKLLCDLIRARTLPAKRRIAVTGAPFLAKGDGSHDDTAALQAAIDSCGPEDMVYLPPGVYLSGALTLHSDMEFYIAEGALLKGRTEAEAYLPQIHSRFEGIERMCFKSLVNIGEMDHMGGTASGNIIIRGGGAIEGGGCILMENEIRCETARLTGEGVADGTDPKSFGEEEAAHESFETHGAAYALRRSSSGEDIIPGRARGRLINISNSHHVRISGLTLKNGPGWNIHMIYSENIITDHCRIISEGVENGDGWDPDSSSDCTLFASTLHTSDDAIAVKSGKNPEGNRIGRPSRNIRVFDCVCTSLYHGFAIGSEISGGIEGVYIWDCDLSGSAGGLEVKYTSRRGGYVRDVKATDSSFSRVRIHEVPYNDDGESAGIYPEISGISLENCTIGQPPWSGLSKCFLHYL